jgi:hypothetical protein
MYAHYSIKHNMITGVNNNASSNMGDAVVTLTDEFALDLIKGRVNQSTLGLDAANDAESAHWILTSDSLISRLPLVRVTQREANVTIDVKKSALSFTLNAELTKEQKDELLAEFGELLIFYIVDDFMNVLDRFEVAIATLWTPKSKVRISATLGDNQLFMKKSVSCALK